MLFCAVRLHTSPLGGLYTSHGSGPRACTTTVRCTVPPWSDSRRVVGTGGADCMSAVERMAYSTGWGRTLRRKSEKRAYERGNHEYRHVGESEGQPIKKWAR